MKNGLEVSRETVKEKRHSKLYSIFCAIHHTSILFLFFWFATKGPRPSPVSVALWWFYSDLYRYDNIVKLLLIKCKVNHLFISL
jgi:hypothetical protein